MIYAFGDFELDEEHYELRRAGAPIGLEPKAFRVLAYLVRHHERVVTRDELLERFWPGEFVTESALAHCIVKARQAVGDRGMAQRAIKTVHGHGYRFAAAVVTRLSGVATTGVPQTPLPPVPEELPPISDASEPLPTQPRTSRDSPEGERKQATVLSVGVKGLPALAQALDSEAFPAVFRRLLDLMRAEVQRVEGHVSLATGDGLRAVFGAPIAHEDHALRALHAALGARCAFTAFAEDLRHAQGTTLALRIGLHTGPVVVGATDSAGHLDDTAQGFTGYLADGLQQLAREGTIAVSETVRRQTEGFFRFKELGEWALPDIAQPVYVYECAGVNQVSTRLEALLRRHLSAFRGREREIDLLNALWTRARGGHGQVVCLFGEAGVGKSRLAYEFQRTLAEACTLQAQALSHGQAMPYHAFIPLLRALLQVDGNDPLYDQRQQIRTRLHTIDPRLAEDEPLLSHLLGISLGAEPLPSLPPEAWKRRLQHVCQQLILSQAAERPLCLLIEDGHWLDSSSRELLDLLVMSLVSRRIFLLVSARPGFRHTWDDLTNFHRLTVEPLTEAHTDALIRRYLQPHDAAPALKALVRERTGGNPFFVEEFLHALQEQGLLTLRDDGYAMQAGACPDLPSSVHGVLAARVDRLPAAEKRLLQTAAVGGMEVPLSLLEAIAGEPRDAFERRLLHLQAAEFLYEAGHLPERTLAFKHALTHEVVYGSLLRGRRRALHAQILETLEARSPDRLDEQVDVLAHHAFQGEVWGKAFVYLCKSGDKARQAYANEEAIGFYTQAIEVSERITPPPDAAQLLPLYEGRGLVWMLLTNYEAALADFQRMRQLAQASGNLQKEGESLGHLAYVHWLTFSEEHVPFIEQHGREALRLARQTGDQKTLARSLIGLGSVDQVRGHIPEADRKFAEALQISRRQGYQDSLAHALVFLCMQACLQGKFHAATRLGQEGVVISRAIHDGFTELRTLAFLCQATWGAGHFAQAFTMLHEAMATSKERQNTFFVGRLTNTLGWFSREFGAASRAVELDHESLELGRAARISNVEISALINLGFDYLALGQYERALAALQPTLERVQHEAFGVHRWRWQTRLLIGLAEVHSAMGAYEHALRAVEDGLEQAQATASQKYVANAWALRGKILIALGRREAGGRELQRAFKLVEQLRSPPLTYPIAYDLGQWFEMTGNERRAMVLYGKAKATIEHMLAAVEEPSLQASFRQSELVQTILACAARVGA
ncbi:MAG TPA: AAA family ATPase [Candidatus Tectomicrobia bacterium]|nr:AAA family ATPase [Candidatus Tectomicrobia bacterium]